MRRVAPRSGERRPRAGVHRDSGIGAGPCSPARSTLADAADRHEDRRFFDLPENIGPGAALGPEVLAAYKRVANPNGDKDYFPVGGRLLGDK